MRGRRGEMRQEKTGRRRKEEERGEHKGREGRRNWENTKVEEGEREEETGER